MKISVVLVCLLFLACSRSVETPAPITEALPLSDETQFAPRPGDLLFQDSDCGPFCDAIEKVTFGVDGAKFSHVGMLVSQDDETLAVLEAISAGVLLTPLDSFLNRSFDAAGDPKVLVGRMKPAYRKLLPDAIAYATGKLGAPYDTVFDFTNDAYYCSELLHEAFQTANGGEPIFQPQPMTYNDPVTGELFPVWAEYFQELNAPVPEGEPGLNPGGMSRSAFVEIVHVYGRPEGYIK